jgi:glycosyltransferase involved in cell wall biosynthesis
MKILHVETGRHFYGGPQQVAWLLSGLERAGIGNVLVCPPGSGIDAAARAAGVRVRNLACAGDADLRFAWRLREVLRAERPDLLHSHSRRGADLMGGVAARLARVPAIVSRRVDHPEPAWLARVRYAGYARIVAISDAVAAALSASGVDFGRLVVIRSAVAPGNPAGSAERERLARELGLPADALAIAAVGQLIPRKGHDCLLRAMARVAATVPQAQLAVFGRGPLEPALRGESARLGIAGRVRFAGFRPDLDEYLGAFDILVHPALREGLGVAMLKAAAAGVPVIAFDVAGAREAVRHGETGLLVPTGDAAALADAIVRLATDEPLRRRMGAAGRDRMQRDFSIESMVDAHVRLYDSVLHGSD